jgi:predicted ester cyclase
MSVQDDNKAFVRRFIEYVNNDPLAPIDEFFASSYTYHNSSSPDVKDLASLKEFNAAAYSAFPDIRITIEDMVAEGDKVVYRGSARATHKGEFMGIAPTGKEVTLTTIVISRVANGKFQEDWESLDGIYILQQLGAVPTTSRSER